MQSLNKITSNFTESVIRNMTKRAIANNAINLSQGFPEFDPPREILNKLSEIATVGPHQYSITSGANNFKSALAKKFSRFTGLEIDPEENIVVTCGGTEAMMSAMLSIVNPNDKVIVFSPFYENYGADAILSRAEPIYVELAPPNFTFDLGDLENAFKQNPKAIILNNPSNPCGRVFTRDELEIIAELAEKYDTYVITDEVYEHIVYSPNEHIYFATLKNMWKRTISTSSLSKTYSITGWRLGYVIAPKEIIDTVKKVHDFLTVGAAAPLQEAAIVGLEFSNSYYENLQKKYTKLRDIFCSGLDDIGLEYFKPEGTYFVMVNIDKFSAKNDVEFAYELTEKIKVAPVPGSSFFKAPVSNYVRFHFAKNEDTLYESLNRLSKINTLLK